MRVPVLKNAITELIRYAGKEAYLIKNHLYLEINQDGTKISFYTLKDNEISITIYFSEAIYYKFFIDDTGSLLPDKGSTPDLIERYGVNYLLTLLENASENLIKIGMAAIDTGNYIFRDTSKDMNIDESINSPGNKPDTGNIH